SFGPILSERAETIGRHRFSFGTVDQYFDFTKVDGIFSSYIPFAAAFGNGVYIAGSYNNLHFRINQSTLFATFGLTDRLEVSVAQPLIHSQFGGTLNEQLHVGPAVVVASSTTNRSATGIGDLQFQVKANLVRTQSVSVALGARVRTPTGDPYDLT